MLIYFHELKMLLNHSWAWLYFENGKTEMMFIESYSVIYKSTNLDSRDVRNIISINRLYLEIWNLTFEIIFQLEVIVYNILFKIIVINLCFYFLNNNSQSLLKLLNERLGNCPNYVSLGLANIFFKRNITMVFRM